MKLFICILCTFFIVACESGRPDKTSKEVNNSSEIVIEENPDGSVTITENRDNGNTVVTIVNLDGSTTVTTTYPDGTTEVKTTPPDGKGKLPIMKLNEGAFNKSRLG